MSRPIVLALVLSLAISSHATAARPPSAIELAGATAACMTYGMAYPDGQGVAASGSIYEATLLETDGYPFGIVTRSLDAGGYDLELKPIDQQSPAAVAYAYKRGNVARDCFHQEYARLDEGHDWRPSSSW